MGRIPPYTQAHIVSLTGAVISSIVLAITVNCVWYPYLQTSSFYASVCTVGNIVTVYGATACPSAQCPSGAPPSPSPPYYTIHLNTSRTPPTFSSTTAATTGQNIAAVTTASATEAPTNESTTNQSTASSSTTLFQTVTHGDLTTPSWLNQPGCYWFPCIKLPVFFKATGDIIIVAGSGQLYPNYAQLQNYPSCSYSSCQSNNEENSNAVREWVNSIVSSGQFDCYVNEYNFDQILQEVNFSYGAAINSILWPILSLIVFGTVFICLRLAAYCPRNRTSSGPPAAVLDDTASATPYSVNYSNPGNGMQGGYAISLPLPPAYQDVAGAGVNNTGLDYATVSEKNPADFASARGDAEGDRSTGGATGGSWVVMYPPNYADASSLDEDKKLPVVGASGGPYEDGAVAFSYPVHRSATPGTLFGQTTASPAAAAAAVETDLGVAGTAARY